MIDLDADHRYTVDGVPQPGVSEILKTVGVLNVYGWDHGWGRERGSAVHRACQLDDEGDLDEASLDPRVLPFLTAWRNFRDYYGLAFLAIEEKMASPLGFCGTPDRVARSAKVDDTLLVIDIKTNSAAWWARYQVAGYDQLLRDQPNDRWMATWDHVERWIVILKPTFTFEVQMFKGYEDVKQFLAMLSTAQLIYQHHGGLDGYRNRPPRSTEYERRTDTITALLQGGATPEHQHE